LLKLNELITLIKFYLPIAVRRQNISPNEEALDNIILDWVHDGMIPPREKLIKWICTKLFIDEKLKLGLVNEIEEFKDGQLNDVTREPRFRDRLRFELQRTESDPSTNWNSNGFLAGWAAMKSLLGEQDDAFRRLLPLYDRTNQFGVMECAVPTSIAKCPADKRKLLPFPEGLKKHLVSQKYLTGKQAAGLPFGDSELPLNESPVKDPSTPKAVDPNESKPELRISSDVSLSSLSKQEICRYAVTNTHFGTVPAYWDDRPAYSDYLKEAKSRGYTIESCQALIGK
jgi:hypothetical protein